MSIEVKIYRKNRIIVTCNAISKVTDPKTLLALRKKIVRYFGVIQLRWNSAINGWVGSIEDLGEVQRIIKDTSTSESFQRLLSSIDLSPSDKVGNTSVYQERKSQSKYHRAASDGEDEDEEEHPSAVPGVVKKEEPLSPILSDQEDNRSLARKIRELNRRLTKIEITQ
jgi:hypothetical protein